MKKTYQEPATEIITFEAADVIITSKATDYNYNPTTGNREGPYDGRYDR